MSRTPLNRVLDELQRAVEPADADTSDARLMERFIGQRDEQAFAALVRRHGPMVHGVCRRVLGNQNDAEDVFQATFLVLVRRARSVRRLASVGSWLYGVAYRTAQEARRAMARRRAKETRVPQRAAPADQAGLDELRAVLDVELARLPERYRQVIVLCDLEGLGRKEAARRIGCPDGTVASRLAKARSLLAARLTRHGLTLSAAALATALAAEGASASLPAAWLPATVTAARSFAAGTAGVVSAKVTSLVQGVCRTMLVKQLTTIGVTLIVTALTGLGVGIFYLQTATAGPPGDDDVAKAAAPNKPQDAPQELRRLKEELQQLRDKAKALEARVAELEKEQPEVLFRGKPASYWTRALRDRDRKFRQEALVALGGIAEVDRSVIPTIMASLLNDTDDEVRGSASEVLIGMVGEPALPLLIAALKDAKQDHRLWAMWTLGRCGDGAKPAVPALTALLKSSKMPDRFGAAQTLGYIGPDAAAAVPALMELLKDRNARECYRAVTALGQIGPSAKPAIPLLIEFLQDRQERRFPFDRSLVPVWSSDLVATPAISAAVALGDMGPAARMALPELRAAATDVRLRPTIQPVIEKIEPAKEQR